MTKEEIFEKLENKIKNSHPGVGLWFSRSAYDLYVRGEDQSISFEEWFVEILENS